jgi:cytochrome b561
MSLRNIERWGPVSQVLHWTIVVLVAGLAVVGLSLDSLPRSPSSLWVYDLHKSTGLTVLALAVARLAWRLYAGRPRPIPGIPRIQRAAAAATHALLYLLIFAMPLSGWMMDSASGLRPLAWFGLFHVPKLVAPHEALAEQAETVHETLFLVLLALVVLHVAAAFYHHLFRGDATLARMLPRGWLRTRDPGADAHG